ncbi:MAG TPA: sugar phosphate isomerase/epimerase, partial [Clostridiales bacterium]|nr:sugar phosphate isomerase/epimerase [Clostridiales bacterium]
PTLIETDELSDCAVLCAELGLQFIELNMNLPKYQLDKIDVLVFKKIMKKYGIYYTVHLDENLNVSDFNPYIAEGYCRTVYETIMFAREIGTPVFNMHLSQGVYFTMPDKKVYLFDEYKDRYLRSISQFRDKCKEIIGKSNIKICVENSSGYKDFQIDALDILLKSPVFGLTFDIGHNNGIGGTDEAVIMARKDKLFHMHIHDSTGKRDHLALGTGELELRKYLSLAKETNSRVVLETKTVAALKESVRWVKEEYIK